MNKTGIWEKIAWKIGLHDGEKILLVAHRHPLLLFRRLLLPLVLAIGCMSVLIFRIQGGQFLVTDAAVAQQSTVGDQMLTYPLIATVLVALFMPRSLPRHTLLRAIFVGISILLASLLFFRAQGGQLVTVDPYTAPTFDLFNAVLIIITVFTLFFVLYTWRDWEADRIVLTNQRVIYEFEKPWIRRIQEYLSLNDIQQVEAKTKTYLEHWFDFGVVSIQSASVGRPMLFRGVRKPHNVQDRIMTEVRRTEQEKSNSDFQHLIETRVYKDGSSKPQRKSKIQHSYTPHTLSWLFPENPRFDPEQEAYIWHPHWFFLVKALLVPMTGLILSLMVLFSVAMFGLAPQAILWIGLLIVILVFGGWGAWEFEDHRNERYIVTPLEVMDVHKKPLGPQTTSSAGLDSLQNVTYKTTLIGRLIGYGDVILETAGAGDALTFRDIPQPREVVSIIDAYQVEFYQTQKERNLEDTLKLLRYYHADQQQRDKDQNGQHGNIMNGGKRSPDPVPGTAVVSAG